MSKIKKTCPSLANLIHAFLHSKSFSETAKIWNKLTHECFPKAYDLGVFQIQCYWILGA